MSLWALFGGILIPEGCSRLYLYMEGFIDSPTGLNAFYRYWTPEVKTKGLIDGVHGFAEHCGRYIHIGEALSEYGMHSICMT